MCSYISIMIMEHFFEMYTLKTLEVKAKVETNNENNNKLIIVTQQHQQQ